MVVFKFLDSVLHLISGHSIKLFVVTVCKGTNPLFCFAALKTFTAADCNEVNHSEKVMYVL